VDEKREWTLTYNFLPPAPNFAAALNYEG